MIWTDPRSIDYFDGLNPARLPQFGADLRPFDHATLQHPLYQAIRKAATYETHLQPVPDGANSLIAARASYEARFHIPAGSFLYAMTASSEQPEGFKYQVTDLRDSSNVFRNAIHHTHASGGTGSTQGISNPLFFLQRPRAILEPGLMSATITNLSGEDNEIQLILWFVQPRQDRYLQLPPNEYDVYLSQELDRASRAVRGHQPSSTRESGMIPAAIAPPPPQAQMPPWLAMPENGSPLFYLNVVPTPAAGTEDYAVVSFRVPAGFRAAMNRIRHRYIGPAFSEGSGDLIWRIAVDGAHAPGYDNMTVQVGADSFEEISGAIIADSGQLVEYTVSVAAAANLGDSKILSGIQGHFYPQER